MEGNPDATIVADLAHADHLPSNVFDAIIFTQTLQVIYDIRTTIATLYRILKPGGVLLVTASGMAQLSLEDFDKWGEYWRFTSLSARLLFEEAFSAGNVTVRSYGNVLAAISFLEGLAVEDLKKKELDAVDRSYEVSDRHPCSQAGKCHMRVPGVKTAKTFSRWVQARILGGALILGYHRVAHVTRDEYEVCVTPKHFAEQMEMVNKYAYPISLAKLVQYLKAGSLPPKSVAVTFDDGYADNLYEAKPILEKYQIPATVFVCTGYVGREFWWDELDRLVMSTQADLGALRLQIGRKLVYRGISPK